MRAPGSFRLAILPALAFAVLLLQSCRPDSAEDPAFKKQEAAIQRVSNQLKGLRGELKKTNEKLEHLTSEIERVERIAQMGVAAGPLLERQIRALEAAIQNPNKEAGKFPVVAGDSLSSGTATRSATKPAAQQPPTNRPRQGKPAPRNAQGRKAPAKPLTNR